MMQNILIDGAIDRKSIASPETSDAIILSTGAVLSRSLKKVVEETAHIVNLYSIPELEEGEARDLIEENNFDDKIMIINKGGEVRKLDLATGLGASRFIDDAIEDDTEFVYIPGAFTNSVIADINPKKLKKVRFILKNPTKIFLSVMDWGRWRKRGFKVNVLQNIKIAAITVNPWAPSGYTFDSDMLVGAMEEALPDIPIVDVRV